jgi:hypothetical protein
VRRSDSSKQRLWLGPGQYRDRGRDTATNPGSDFYTTSNSYSVRPDDANAYSYGEFTSSDSHTYTHSYGYCNASTITDAYPERYHPANANTYANRTSTAAQAYAKTSTNSASSAVTPESSNRRIGESENGRIDNALAVSPFLPFWLSALARKRNWDYQRT